jgi:hypothetical protein
VATRRWRLYSRHLKKVFRDSRAVIVVTTGTGIAFHVPRDDTGDEAHAQRLRARPASAILS